MYLGGGLIRLFFKKCSYWKSYRFVFKKLLIRKSRDGQEFGKSSLYSLEVP